MNYKLVVVTTLTGVVLYFEVIGGERQLHVLEQKYNTTPLTWNEANIGTASGSVFYVSSQK